MAISIVALLPLRCQSAKPSSENPQDFRVNPPFHNQQDIIQNNPRYSRVTMIQDDSILGDGCGQNIAHPLIKSLVISSGDYAHNLVRDFAFLLDKAPTHIFPKPKNDSKLHHPLTIR